jgi:hypothetical protein
VDHASSFLSLKPVHNGNPPIPATIRARPERSATAPAGPVPSDIAETAALRQSVSGGPYSILIPQKKSGVLHMEAHLSSL